MAARVDGFFSGAAAAVAMARSNLGYRETPNNRTKFGKHYGWDGVAWCVQFAWYCGDVTGSGGGVPKTASTGAAMRWAKSVGRWRTTPQPGDWSIMVNSRGATIHTDLVESYSNGRLVCIGGNTSGTYKGSVNEGNGVYRNDRTAKWKQGRILGFVRPLYGVTVEDVKAVQRAQGIKVDGKYGPATRDAVVALQKRLGVKADGFPGPSTMAALTGAAVVPSAPTASAPVERPSTKADGSLYVDGTWDREDSKALQRFLNSRVKSRVLKIDGRADEQTWRSFQEYLGTPADGVVSHQSRTPAQVGDGISPNGWDHSGPGADGSTMVRALQRWVRVEDDGVWGPETTKALTRKLNDHRVGMK